MLPIGAIALNILKTLSFPVRSGSQKYRLLTELKEKYCVYTDYLAAAKDLAPSVTRALLLEVLNLVPGVGQHVGLYVSQNCTE